MNRYRMAAIAAALALLLGLAGHMDYEDQQAQAALYCDMVKARNLVTEQGMTPYAAAQKVGLTRSAIYMALWYKVWKAAQK